MRSGGERLSAVVRGLDVKGQQVAQRAHYLSRKDWMMLGWAVADPWLRRVETGTDAEE